MAQRPSTWLLALSLLPGPLYADIAPGPSTPVICHGSCAPRPGRECLQRNLAQDEGPMAQPAPDEQAFFARWGFAHVCTGPTIVALGGRFCTPQRSVDVWCRAPGEAPIPDDDVPRRYRPYRPPPPSRPTPPPERAPDTTTPPTPAPEVPAPLPSQPAERPSARSNGCAAGPSNQGSLPGSLAVGLLALLAAARRARSATRDQQRPVETSRDPMSQGQRLRSKLSMREPSSRRADQRRAPTEASRTA